MNLEHKFIAERAAAQHCAELLRGAADPVELLPRLARTAERIARALGPALAALLGGEDLVLTPAAAQETDGAELVRQIGPLAANSLLASAAAGVTLLASIQGGAVLGLVDRAFGGKGALPEALPEKFPLSAEMLVARLEGIVAKSLAQALALPDLAAVRSDSRIEELTPFVPAERLARLRIDVAQPKAAPWSILLAIPLEQLPRLLGNADDQAPGNRRSGPADPAAAPFADLPLPLCARLVDMHLPLSALADLAPGLVLPVAVERSVPLRIGGTVLARGTVGNADDRIAIKLTHLA